MESLIKSVEYVGMLNIGDYIPFVAWMDLQVSILIEVYEYILKIECYLEWNTMFSTNCDCYQYEYIWG